MKRGRRLRLGLFTATLCLVGSLIGSVVMRQRAAVAAIPPEARGKLVIFILAGQSNMRAQDLEPEQIKYDPQIFMFDYNFRWRPAMTTDGGAVNVNHGLGAGPGLAFAQQLRRQDPSLTIGLIQCAQYGTGMSEWAPDSQRWTLYATCIQRARSALKMGRIGGVLFFQGETEGLDMPRYPDAAVVPDRWGADFITLVKAFRSDLDSPQLPIVFAQLGPTPPTAPYWETVKAQQRAVHYPCVAMITSDDLPLRDDVHFTFSGYQTLGQRYAEAYDKLVKACGHRPS